VSVLVVKNLFPVVSADVRKLDYELKVVRKAEAEEAGSLASGRTLTRLPPLRFYRSFGKLNFHLRTAVRFGYN
jgi:hypothetical protein